MSKKTAVEQPVNYNEMPRNLRMRPYYIIAPGMIILIGIMIPFLTAILLSLTDASYRNPIDSWKWNWFRNWLSFDTVEGKLQIGGLFASSQFYHAIAITVIYALSATIFELLLGMGIAFLLRKDSRYCRILKVTLMFPLMVAPVIAVLIWQLMINGSVGIIEKALSVIGLGGFTWASSPKTAMFTVVLIDAWVNTPFMLLLILAGIQSLPKSPFEAAQVDGASAWFTFKTLTLPMLKPFIYIAVLFRLMASLQEFGIIYALTKGGPGDALMNISVTSYITGFVYQRLGRALPYLLVLWIIVNISAKFLVEKQRKYAKEAAGL
ncbi:MAG: sugar ABC transporter permease [Spirochaetaceae bacterium]|jgi:multiple sugar transport system permease protein|nr:sugar ABC transporter permease [Spirochaetaceae bacterium]GMO29647.1 MAG: sugar ABC transporter permease [Termitinemataceae bacterium]